MAEIRVGTSGFAYGEWKPGFYPENLPQKRFLEFYASRFSAVEIDYTFYRMPSPKTLDGWMASTPEEFRFALKASRKITHFDRLRVPSEPVDYLQDVLLRLGPRLGMLLYQLPPNFKKDAARLALFLGGLDRRIPAAFEFRHESWFSEETYSMLRDHDAALAIHDSDEQTTPLEITAARTYVRLRKSVYSASDRETWISRWKEWRGAGTDVFVFIKHEDNPDAPAIADEFSQAI